MPLDTIKDLFGKFKFSHATPTVTGEDIVLLWVESPASNDLRLNQSLVWSAPLVRERAGQDRFTGNCRGSAVLFLHTLARDPTHPDLSMRMHLNTFRRTFPVGYMIPSRVYVVPTMDKSCRLSDDKVTERMSQLTDQVTSLNKPGTWHASMFSEVFRGQPETTSQLGTCQPSEKAWEVVQVVLQDMGTPHTLGTTCIAGATSS
ncbi:hypothetical protein ID866_3751 [Astraeus odoratus]|nr:hypothetical protein ID866_3751 [Astraeus odoratus]